MNYDVIVIGSGPAGFEAALRLGQGGSRTALITTTPAGGRTTVGSLLPSKVWLHAAHQRPRATGAGAPARMTAEETLATAAHLREAVSRRVQYTSEALRRAGVEIISGSATIVAPGHVTVRSGEAGTASAEIRQLTATALVVATGSEPTFTPSVRPDGERIIAPRLTRELREVPESLIMVGGGITGVEYSEAFARLGSRVTLLSSKEIVPSFYRPYAERLAEHLRSVGVTLVTGQRVSTVERAGDEPGGRVRATTERGEEYRADMAFIATGRAADLTVFGGAEGSLPEQITDEAGRFIPVDPYGRTAVPGIYACGDATGPPFTANRALWQGRQVAAAILGAAGTVGAAGAVGAAGPVGAAGAVGAAGPVDAAGAVGASGPVGAAGARVPALIEAIFTDPQLAQVGQVGHESQTGHEGQTAGGGPVTYRRGFDASMLHTIDGSRPNRDTAPGELTVWTTPSGEIRGAAAFGPGAAEVLAPIQLAINNGITWQDVSAVPFAYPTLSEVITS